MNLNVSKISFIFYAMYTLLDTHYYHYYCKIVLINKSFLHIVTILQKRPGFLKIRILSEYHL